MDRKPRYLSRIGPTRAEASRGWRRVVLERDGYACVWCGCTDNLHAHHIERRTDRPDLEYALDNGVTLCVECHANEHKGDFRPAFIAAWRRRRVVP